MISFQNGGRLVQSTAELPDLSRVKRLYLDLETTSGDPQKTSLNPWKNCAVLGVSATADDAPGAWYVPMRHHDPRWNLPLEVAQRWLRATLSSAHTWVNHNVKYDAHCARLDGAPFEGELVCTVVASKLIDSDRIYRGGYGLSALSKYWLEEDISRYEEALAPYLGKRNKDYGAIPGDILGEYSCQDVLTNRRLDAYIRRRMPEQCQAVWRTEVLLTPVLIDIEVAGLLVDPSELRAKEYVLMHKMLKLEQSIHERTGAAIRPHVNDDCYDLLCNRYGLPTLGYTDKGDPSFDKATMQSYAQYPLVKESPELLATVQDILAYRKLNTLLTFFVRPYQELQVGGLLHPNFNQSVRTGRMSCTDPNAQQLSKGEDGAKALVHPGEGEGFMSWDYSQVEFRLMVHYIHDVAAIQAYANDPDTDFHQWVADMCGIKRRPAKNVNFAMGYGASKGRVLKMLRADMDLVGDLMPRAREMAASSGGDEVRWFQVLSERRAEAVYNTYHRRLPGIKRSSYKAADRARSRGYVFNLYGRHRHMSESDAYHAFNAVVQSCAADLMKERTVAVAPRYNARIRGLGVKIVALVHDELLMRAPTEVIRDPTAQRYIAEELERVSVALDVPIRVGLGVSDRSWSEACSDKAVVKINREA